MLRSAEPCLAHTDCPQASSHLASPINTLESPYENRQPSRSESTSKPLHDNIASADLQNPSDALEILAHVADRAEDGDSDPSDLNQLNGPAQQLRPVPSRAPSNTLDMVDQFHYPPLAQRLIGAEIIYQLIIKYVSWVTLVEVI